MEHELQRESISKIPDDELLRRLQDLLHQSRRVEAELIVHIAEADARRLYARYASSMFKYVTECLHLSEAEAYLRIEVARASRKHPVLLEMLADGRLHLSGITLLHAHLTDANQESLLNRAAYRSKRQIEELVAEISPKPDVPASIRKLPERRAVATRSEELVPERVGRLSPDPESDHREAQKPVANPPAPAPQTRRGETDISGEVQDRVHRQCRSSRQAGATSRTHALVGP